MEVTVYYATEFGIKHRKIELEEMPSFCDKFKIIRIENE